jgi:hypothetical protein
MEKAADPRPCFGGGAITANALPGNGWGLLALGDHFESPIAQN